MCIFIQNWATSKLDLGEQHVYLFFPIFISVL